MFYVEHYIVDSPEQVVQVYGPFATREEAEAEVKLCRDFGDEFEWDGRIVTRQSSY